MHQKRRIDGNGLAVWAVRIVDYVGVGVAAEPRVGFIQRHPVSPGQCIGGGEARDAAADDRYRSRM